MEPRVKIWIGMGAWLLASASPAAIATATATGKDDARGAAPLGASAHPGMMAQQHAMPMPMTQSQGGEGGEGGEGGASAVFDEATPEQAFMGRLLLIKGHLLVGQELYDQGHPDDALQHFQHPLVEIYDYIEPDLTARKAKQFKPALEKLVGLVEKKVDKAQVTQERKKVLAAIDTASHAVPAKIRNSPEFIAKVTVLALRQAAEEYEGSIENGRILNPVEYQDSRGFMLTARDYFLKARGTLRPKDPEVYDLMRTQFDKLRPGWPSVFAPEKPVLEYGEVQAIISQIELRTGRFH
jgi:hypothetical protein